MTINAAFIALKKDFDTSRGRSINTYIYNLYKNMILLQNKFNINVDKVAFDSFPDLGNGLSFTLSSIVKNYTKYDIIHNPDFKPFFPFRKDKALHVSTIHGLEYKKMPELNKDMKHDIRGLIRLHIVIPLDFWSLWRSDYVISVSKLLKEHAISLGYERKRIDVVNQAIEDKFFTPIKHIKKDNKFIVGYLGTFRTRKNVLFAIDSFKLINDKNMQFNIHGNASFEYKEMVNAIKDDSRIKYKGYVPTDKIVETYDTFNAFVFPTLYEGFGIPILEAQTRGIPVVIYKKSKITEEVRRYCIEANDKEHMAEILEKLKNNGYNEKARKKAIEYSRSFTWSKTASETLQFYKKIIDNRQ